MTKDISEFTTDELIDHALDNTSQIASTIVLIAIAKELKRMNDFNAGLQGFLHGFLFERRDLLHPSEDDDDPADPDYESPFKDVPY